MSAENTATATETTTEVRKVPVADVFNQLSAIMTNVKKLVKTSDATIRVYRGIEFEPVDLPAENVDWGGESQYPEQWRSASWPQDATEAGMPARFRMGPDSPWRHGVLVGREPGGQWFGAGVGWYFYPECQVKAS